MKTNQIKPILMFLSFGYRKMLPNNIVRIIGVFNLCVSFEENMVIVNLLSRSAIFEKFNNRMMVLTYFIKPVRSSNQISSFHRSKCNKRKFVSLLVIILGNSINHFSYVFPLHFIEFSNQPFVFNR